jgi:hypothetical protein
MTAYLVGPRNAVADMLRSTNMYGPMEFVQVAPSSLEGEKR